MSNELYDTLKWIVMIFLPAFTTFVSGLGEKFNWEQATLATSFLTLFTAFLGSLLVTSSIKYNKEDK